MSIYESWLVKQPIAHRGLFDDKIPENSLAAFKNAVKNKLPIELDVSLLTDGTPVIFHDEKLARMTGKDGFISNCKYEDIQKLTLAGTKERIPTLQEALDLIDGKVPILVEIKNYGKVGPFEKAVWKVLQNYKGEYAVESFNPYSVEWFKVNAPKVKRGQIAAFTEEKEIIGVRRFIVYKTENLPNKYVKKYYGEIPVLAYTVKNEEEEIRVNGFADNIIFDSYTPTSLKK